MQQAHKRPGRRWAFCFGVCAVLLASLTSQIVAEDDASLTSQIATAEDPPPIIDRVEIDWSVRVRTPNAARGVPELIFVLSPYADVQGMHSLFSVNHRIEGGPQNGGFQNQIWSGSSLVRAKKGPSDIVMNTPDEVITFTHVMQVNTANLRLDFDVINLQSSTWGTLTGNFANTYKEGGVTNLNQFFLKTTINESGVAAGGSRVEYMDLLRVRTYTQTGLLRDVAVNHRVYHGVSVNVGTVETINERGQYVPK